ncbi:hypothetical protein THRCLA_01325 [Thraustotheca clavata]|uniref:Uncharacterized protein n=1 Tax=Thraustotheca clavata TaxID=74557 RepID=A0A1W0A8M7_9STRA|nr:hypothetical protein THRCLA_01325 [Thraustotheca clavata]
MDGECAVIIADALKNCKTLQSIVLHDCILHQAFFQNNISDTLKSIVATGIQASYLPLISNSILNSSLQSLKLQFQYPSPSEDIVNEFICSCLPTLPQLRKLELAHLTLSTRTIKFISNILPQLYELSLESNELEDVGIISLVLQLPECHHLHALRLDNQGCTDIGAISIVQAIKEYCIWVEIELALMVLKP